MKCARSARSAEFGAENQTVTRGALSLLVNRPSRYRSTQTTVSHLLYSELTLYEM